MKVINRDHQKILRIIKTSSCVEEPDFVGFGLKYIGTNKPSYHLDTATTRKIAKDFLKSRDLSLQEFTSLVDSMYTGDTCDELFIAAKIVEFSASHKKSFCLSHLDKWLDNVHGWAETDVLCQMAFTDQEMLSRLADWHKIINKFVVDKNVHKRRASLVLLTKPVRLSSDQRLADIAFANVDKLKHESDILITKAVSWLLRALIKHHKAEVANYLDNNKDTLPRIAVREVSTKLQTGKKYIKTKYDNKKKDLA